MLPLDITTPHELPFPVYKDEVDPSFDSPANPSKADDKSPLVHFTSSFLEQTRHIMLQFGKDAMELHDIVTVWCAIENPPGLDLNTNWGETLRDFDIERSVSALPVLCFVYEDDTDAVIPTLFRYGELTRGMLVVDRRQDEGAFELGANRAQVEKDSSHAQPAPVECEVPPSMESDHDKVRCIVRTPGPDVLLKLLVRRVWGVT